MVVRGRGAVFGLAVAAALAGSTVPAGAAAPAARSTAASSTATSNAVSFTVPGGVVQGSAAVYTRAPSGLTVTLSARPTGRRAAVAVTVANTGPSTVRFGSGGLRAVVSATCDGRRAGAWVLRAGRTRTLAPGGRVTLARTVALSRPGVYELVATVRFAP